MFLILAIQEAEGTLANKILSEQVAMGFDGTAKQATEICEEIGLPDIISNHVTKTDIKEAIYWHHYKCLKEEMAPLKKLKHLSMKDLTKPQPFLEYSLDEARMGTRLAVGMLDIAGDMPARYRGREGCRACSPLARGEEGPEAWETKEHLLECHGYSHLWGEKCDERETIKYFMRVMKERVDIGH